MIEKGSAIASQSQDLAISNLVEKTETQKGSAPEKLAKAVVQ
jgi:hypothetical protein